jgi:hypothetical protein
VCGAAPVVACIVCLRLRLRHDAGGGAERRADQEGTTALVVLAAALVVLLAHVDSSLGIFSGWENKNSLPCTMSLRFGADIGKANVHAQPSA